MSNDLAKIMGTFADFKLVKTRQVAQFVVEVPLAEADKALDALGGLPRPESERWIALARIDLSKNVARLEDHRQKRKWDDLKLAAQAGIRCGEPAFQRYLAENHLGECPDEKTAVAFVHQYCGIHSRAGLNDNPKAAAKWVQLDSLFQLWMRDVG